MKHKKQSPAVRIAKYGIQDEALILFACFWGLLLVLVFWQDASSGEGAELNLHAAGLTAVVFASSFALFKIFIKVRAYNRSKSKK